jgi:hypothetical protein
MFNHIVFDVKTTDRYDFAVALFFFLVPETGLFHWGFWCFVCVVLEDPSLVTHLLFSFSLAFRRSDYSNSLTESLEQVSFLFLKNKISPNNSLTKLLTHVVTWFNISVVSAIQNHQSDYFSDSACGRTCAVGSVAVWFMPSEFRQRNSETWTVVRLQFGRKPSERLYFLQ